MTESAEVSIRPYEDSDWERLCQIHDAARLDELDGLVDLAVYHPLEEVAEKEGLFEGRVWVSEDGTGVVNGFAAATDDEVTWLYVDPTGYRRGVGRALLRHALTHCEEAVSVMVLADNTPARTLYESEGFEVDKEVTLHFEEGHDAPGVILRREVGA